MTLSGVRKINLKQKNIDKKLHFSDRKKEHTYTHTLLIFLCLPLCLFLSSSLSVFIFLPLFSLPFSICISTLFSLHKFSLSISFSLSQFFSLSLALLSLFLFFIFFSIFISCQHTPSLLFYYEELKKIRNELHNKATRGISCILSGFFGTQNFNVRKNEMNFSNLIFCLFFSHSHTHKNKHTLTHTDGV